MRYLLVAALFCVSCSAQAVHTAKPSDIQTVSGFLNVCDRNPGAISPENAELLEHPIGDVTELLNRAMDASLSDHLLCLGYTTGIYEGWKEGHEHGVIAAHFPEGFPVDESAALKKLSLAELRVTSRAMSVDVPCMPDSLSFGDMQKAVINYLRDDVKKNAFMGLMLTSRAVPRALTATYACPAEKPETTGSVPAH
jgi:hypothetical protein